MSQSLLILVIIALISIAYVWYVTRGLHSLSEDQHLSLDSTDDKLLFHWYKLHTNHSFNFDITDQEIAKKYLHRIYDINVDAHFIVVGTNLSSQYTKLTGKQLLSRYVPNVDCIFDIRSTIGKDGEIAIIYNQKYVDILRHHNNYNLSEINDIIDSEIDILARDFLQDILKFRWEQISQANNTNVLNSEGSYLYLSIPEEILSPETVLLPGNIIAAITPLGARINLLCSNLEFESLISRLNRQVLVS